MLYPEYEGTPWTGTRDDVRAVCSEMPRAEKPGWYLRLFDPTSGTLIEQYPVRSSVVDRGVAQLVGVFSDGGEWSATIHSGGCGC